MSSVFLISSTELRIRKHKYFLVLVNKTSSFCTSTHNFFIIIIFVQFSVQLHDCLHTISYISVFFSMLVRIFDIMATSCTVLVGRQSL